MKSAYLTIMAVLCVNLAACATTIKHEYTWSEYEIAAGRVTAAADMGAGHEVRILKGQSNASTKMLGSIGPHNYYGTEENPTDGMAYQLSKELQKLKFVVAESAGKTLELAVIRSGNAQGMWKTAALLDFTVKFGDGKVKTYSVRNSSPGTVPRAFDGAVALAVIEVLNDPEVLAYLK